jgi:hypothetical protein
LLACKVASLITKTLSKKEAKIHECSFVAFEAQRQVVGLHMAHPTSQKSFKFIKKNQGVPFKNEEKNVWR